MQDAFKVGTVRREDVFANHKTVELNHRPERVKQAFHDARSRSGCRSTTSIAISSIPLSPFGLATSRNLRDERGQVVYDSG